MSAEQGNTTEAPDFAAMSAEHEAEGDIDAAAPTPEVLETPAKVETPAVEAKVDDAVVEDEEVAKAAGVATPDGKHVIPAAELINSRRKVRELTETVDKLSNQLVEATEKLRVAPPGKAADAATDIAANIADAGDDVAAQREALEAGLTTIEAEAPWLAKSVRAMLEPMIGKLGELGAVKKELGALKAERDQDVKAAQASQASTVDTAIANTPLLAHWHEAGGEAWAEAQHIDSVLREQPAWKGKPLEERFAEVARRVAVVLGDEVVPEHLRVKSGETPGLDKNAVVAAAKAKLEGAKPGISSLSDIPGGTPAAASLATELADDAVSPSRLEDLYRGKSTNDIMQVFRT